MHEARLTNCLVPRT